MLLARISDENRVKWHRELWKWAGEKVIILPETLVEIPQIGKKRVDFIPLTASPEEIKKPLSIVTDFLKPLTPIGEHILTM